MSKLRRRLDQFTDDELYARWQNHIDRIKHETYHLFTTRYKWREVERLFRDNPKLKSCGGEVYDWLFWMWSTDALMGIRRELDDQFGVINLRQLLHEMEQRATVLTRRRYVAHLERSDSDFTRQRVFDEFSTLFGEIVQPTAEPLDDYLDPASLRRQREELMAAGRVAFDYAQQMVAHRTPSKPDATLGDINAAIDAIFPVLNRFYVLLHCKAIATAEASLQYDWRESFYFAWYAPPRTDG